MSAVFGCITDKLPPAQRKGFVCNHALKHSYAANPQHSSNTSACREAEQCCNI